MRARGGRARVSYGPGGDHGAVLGPVRALGAGPGSGEGPAAGLRTRSARVQRGHR